MKTRTVGEVNLPKVTRVAASTITPAFWRPIKAIKSPILALIAAFRPMGMLLTRAHGSEDTEDNKEHTFDEDDSQGDLPWDPI